MDVKQVGNSQKGRYYTLNIDYHLQSVIKFLITKNVYDKSLRNSHF
ncbi:hypothetical protein C21_03748 [Arenibacter sp. NBRC 103722]|nr:hypothetical protein C21_03748 [Arenibacter sp. NBRC 103722]